MHHVMCRSYLLISRLCMCNRSLIMHYVMCRSWLLILIPNLMYIICVTRTCDKIQGLADFCIFPKKWKFPTEKKQKEKMCKERRGDIYRCNMDKISVMYLSFQALDRSYVNTNHPYHSSDISHGKYRCLYVFLPTNL